MKTQIHNITFTSLIPYLLLVVFLVFTVFLWKENKTLKNNNNLKSNTVLTDQKENLSDSVKIELTEIKEAKELGKNLYVVHSKGTYISLYLQVQNIRSSSLEIDPKEFAVLTAEGEIYGVSGDGQSGRDLLDERISFFQQPIEPQQTILGQVTFDVLNPTQPIQLLYKGSVIIENIFEEN